MRRTSKSVPRKVYLPEEVDNRIDLYLADPLRGKPIYGGFSQLVTKLLVDFLATRATIQETSNQ